MVPYGGSVPYRNMWRFNSGCFYRHERWKKYNILLAPSVKFLCDINYNPFEVMRDGKKVDGLTFSLFEYGSTIPTLWDSVKGAPEARTKQLSL
ncbi:nucleotide-diphospho-sugar transferase [Flagelloscypha sp. PMI_526]|nr:nucleotide-diphospho-sugar transferase [Flagelloscypha sp. PMI_526]